MPDGFDAYRAPLSALRDAKTIAVVCDEPVVERAPVVDLWLRSARRQGATITYGVPDGDVDALVTDHPGPRHGAKQTSTTCRARRTAAASRMRGARRATASPVDEQPRLLVISGDEAAMDPAVRAIAADTEFVLGIGMFEDSFRGIADLVLPGTSYLERDGTSVNLEGRLQRQRRAVMAPVPDVTMWLAKLAERFEVEVSPHVSVALRRGGRRDASAGSRSATSASVLRFRLGRRRRPKRCQTQPAVSDTRATGLRLVAYRPLFSGAAVERTPELSSSGPTREIQLSRDDAKARGIRSGQTVTVSSNGTSVELRARVAHDLQAGSRPRAARPHR